jgi:hypothetical protein
VTFSLTDVRKRSSLADYTGEVQLAPTVRITDENNGPSGTEAATVDDIRFRMTAACAATTGAGGGTCSLSSTFDSIVPGAVVEGKHGNWELGPFELFDAGPDGDADTSGDNSLFARQGVFVP